MTHIERSIDVDAAAAATWKVFADYGDVGDWHPYFDGAVFETPTTPTGIGAARVCDFGPKMAIRETVTEWREGEAMTIAIDFVRGMPQPLRNILAAVHVTPLGEDRSRLRLTMDYDVGWGPAGALMDVMFIRRQYHTVFGHMLDAAKGYAEAGTIPEQRVMLMSGRRID